MGIRMKTMTVMGVIGLLAIIMISYASYRLNIKSVMSEANIKSNIVLNYAMSTLST